MTDLSKLKDLPADVKVLIVNGKALVEDAMKKMKNLEYGFDLTSKMQLKSDCKEVEKYIKLISSGKLNDKTQKGLEISIIRLQTTVDGLVRFFTR